MVGPEQRGGVMLHLPVELHCTALRCAALHCKPTAGCSCQHCGNITATCWFCVRERGNGKEGGDNIKERQVPRSVDVDVPRRFLPVPELAIVSSSLFGSPPDAVAQTSPRSYEHEGNSHPIASPCLSGNALWRQPDRQGVQISPPSPGAA